MFDLQPIFDRAVTAVLKQTSACTDASGSCVYADDKGNHCAVGHLVDPAVARHLTDIGAGRVHDEEVQVALSPFPIDEGTMGFLDSLQSAHDRAAGISDPERFRTTARRNFTILAEAYDLDPAVLASSPA